MSDQQSSETVVPVENVIPASAKEGGRETSDKVLYIGNLDKSINEDALKQYFQVAGQIVDVKVMVDKKNNHVNYAFIEYSTNHDANVALQTLNGIQIENKNIRINWAFQSQTNLNDDTSFNLFIGDLNVNVDDTTLTNAFKSCPGFLQAHVMWDMQTSRSRGYGFVSFDTHENAQAAMDQMQGHEINGRAIRINWATKRENMNNNNNNNNMSNTNNNNPVRNRMMMEGQQNMPPPPPPMGSLPPVNPQAVEDMIRRAPPRVTTAYIGNIPHFATEADLIPLLQNFGFILDFTHYPEKGCCFIKYDTHEQAAVCIVALSNFQFQGRNLRTGWGKERSTFVPPQGMMPPPMMTSEEEEQQQQQQQLSE